MISFFGIDASTRKYVAQYNKTPELASVLKSSMKLRIKVSILFAVILLLIHQPLAEILGRPEFTQLFLFSVPLVLLASLVEYIKNVFIGLHRIKFNFLINSFAASGQTNFFNLTR